MFEYKNYFSVGKISFGTQFLNLQAAYSALRETLPDVIKYAVLEILSRRTRR